MTKATRVSLNPLLVAILQILDSTGRNSCGTLDLLIDANGGNAGNIEKFHFLKYFHDPDPIPPRHSNYLLYDVIYRLYKAFRSRVL